MNRPPKKTNLLGTVHHCLDENRYHYTRHVLERQRERGIIRPEILYVLRGGFHESRKDFFDESFQAWNYAIRGKTVDLRDLRVIVSFDENYLLIVTAIDLDV